MKLGGGVPAGSKPLMVEAGQVCRSPGVQSGESSWSDLHQLLQSRNPGVQKPAALELGRTHCHLHPSKRKGMHGWVFLCSRPGVRLLPLNPYLHSAASPSFSSFTIAEAEAWKTRVIYKGQSWSWTQGNAAWNPPWFFHTSEVSGNKNMAKKEEKQFLWMVTTCWAQVPYIIITYHPDCPTSFNPVLQMKTNRFREVM